MAALNPDQFFHGTVHDIDDWVVPAKQAGKEPHMYTKGDPGNLSSGDHAFAIKNDEQYAWDAATNFHAGGPRPRVYEVAPTRDMYPGPWNPKNADFKKHLETGGHKEEGTGMDEWASPSGFKVKNQIDTMPGRQGTLPGVNWNDHKSGPRGNFKIYEANHPTDEQVKYGMEGHPQNRNSNPPEKHAPLAEGQFGHDWHKDPAPHSVLREEMGRPQKRWATLLD